MQATLANFVLAALATMTSASPLAAKDAAGAAPVQELAIAAAPAAAGDVTHLEVCIDGYFGGRCQNLANQKGDCFSDRYWTGSSVPGIVHPGIYWLGDYNFNDRASSYRCN